MKAPCRVDAEVHQKIDKGANPTPADASIHPFDLKLKSPAEDV